MTSLAQRAGLPVDEDGRLQDRTAELAMIDSVAERLRSGQGSVVVWLGDPGIGRSTVLRAATEQIRAAVEGAHVINVSGRGVQGGPLAAVALAIHQLLPSVPPIRSDALDRLLKPGADRDPDPSELLRAAVQVLRVASRDRPVIVAIDDSQLAEDGNWSAVTSAAAQVSAARAVILMTGGTTGTATAPLTSTGPLWVRRIAPLSPDAAVKLVQDCVPHFVPRSVAARLGRLLGGNPAALKDVCAALSRDELLGLVPLPDPLPADPSTTERYEPWLSGLPETHRTLLLAAALAVRPSVAIAESVAGVEVAHVIAPAGQPWARVRGGVVEFVDPRLRSAVVKHASHRHVAQVHAALADASTDPVAALWHRSQLGEVLADDDVALLRRAADDLLDAGDFARSLGAARIALASTPAGPDRAELALTAGTAAYHQTYVGLAATLLHEAARDAADPEARHRALAALSLSVAARDGSAPYALVDAALAPLGREVPALAASLACLVARIASDSQQTDLARGYLRQAETFAAAAHRPDHAALGPGSRLLTELEHTRRWVGVTRPGALGTLEHLSIVTSTRPARDLTGWDLAVRQVTLLTRAEDWQQARFALAEVENRQRPLGSRTVWAATSVTALDLHLTVGAVQEAADIVAAVSDELPLRMPFAGIGPCLVARALALRDRRDAALEWLEEARRFAQSTGSPAALVRIPAELAVLSAVAGDPEGAARHLGVAVQRASHFGHRDFAELQLDLLEARHMAGLETRPDEVMPVLEFAWGGPDATSTQRAMLSAARLLLAPAERLVAAALAAVDAAEWQASPLWAGRVMRLAASVLATLPPAEHEEQIRRLAVADAPPNLDDHRRALLQKALSHFTECGALALARLVEAALASTRPKPESESAEPAVKYSQRLTPEEQRVAALVAGGASNRQVASTTYVSVRTVELRLTSIYRKLGIRSRKELADALVERGLPILPHGGNGRGV